MAAEQPPELIQKLEQRRIASPANNEFDPVPQAPSAPAVPQTPTAASEPAKPPTSRDVDVVEIVDIFQELTAALPEAQVFDDRGSVALVGHDVWAQPRIARAFFALAPNRFASTGSGAALSVVVPQEVVSGLAQAAHAQFCTT